MPTFLVAGLSLAIAIVTGIDVLGKPLRMVNLLTIIGLSMMAGVSWMQAVFGARQARSGDRSDPTP